MSEVDKTLVRRWFSEGEEGTQTLENVVKLIQIESNRLKHYLHTLPEAALECPTPCERWSVEDLIAHLIWFAQTYGGMMERGLRGDLSAPEGFPDAGGGSGLANEELYAVESIELRHALGERLLRTFDTHYDWLNAMLQRISPDDWHKPCYHTSGLRSVESFLPTIIQEVAVHEWDIRSSLGPASPLSAASLPVLMSKLPLAKPPTNRRPWTISFPTRHDALRPLRYRFDLRGPGAARLDIVVAGNAPRLEAAGDGPADLSLTGDTSTFILMIYDRISLDGAISTGAFTAEGDQALVVRFDRWLAAH